MAKFLARAHILRGQHLGIPQRLHRREILGGLLVRFEGLTTGGGPLVVQSHQFLHRDDIAAIDNPASTASSLTRDGPKNWILEEQTVNAVGSAPGG